MNKLYSLITILFLSVIPFSGGFGQVGNLKPIAKKISQIHNSQTPAFHAQMNRSAAQSSNAIDLSSTVEEYTLLDFDANQARQIIQAHPGHLELSIPSQNGNIELDLFPSSIFTPDFSVVDASTNKPVNYNQGLHFWGIIKNDNNSIAAISIFPGEIMGVVSSTRGNFVIGKLEGTVVPLHILYNVSDLKIPNGISCLTQDHDKTYSPDELKMPITQSVNCIRIYWEVDYNIYLNKGTVINTTNYVTGLFNQSALIYANDNIPVSLSQVYVWNLPSPYTASTPGALLSQFQSTRTSFNGDLGHLLGTVGNGGVAAGFSGLCNSNVGLSECYSDIQMSYNNVPVYSWSVTVVTHEQGHLMGSRHTHACVWNGNSTAIDGCAPSVGYPYEGSCSGAPIPATGGTIMSYCHLTTVGINFSNGFGPQPAAVILNNYNNATCLTTCNGFFCNAPANLITTGVSTTTATMMWDTVPGAIRYIIHYRIVGTTVWTTDSILAPPYSATGLIPAGDYEWEVSTVCSSGNSFFSSPELFTTVPLTCDPPSNISAPTITSNSILITWNSVPGASAYIIQYRIVGTTSWITDTVNSAPYYAGLLADSTDYEFQIMTLCVGGGSSSFSTSTIFTTMSGNFIVLKPGKRCGKDAFIWSAPPSTHNIENFGEIPFMIVHAYTNSGVPDTTRSLLQFDLSSIPVGSTIQSAYLSLYNDSDAYSFNGEHRSLTHSNASYIRRITQPWNEYTVTWQNQPSATTSNQVTHAASLSAHEHFTNIDVTQLVSDMINDPDHSFGFMVSLQQEQYYCSLVFATSDHVNPQLFPELNIYITPPTDKNYCYEIRNDAGCGGDAFIWNSQMGPNNSTNYDGNTSLLVHAWTNSGVPDTSRSLIGFDLSMLPPGTGITDARLSLFNDSLSISFNGQHNPLSGSNESWIGGITTPWDPSIVTWDDGISYSLTNAGTIPGSTTLHQHFPNLDVTSLTQDMINNPGSYFGYLVRLKSEINYRALILASSDSPDGSKHPLLEICTGQSVGIKNVEQNELSVFPNPANQSLSIYNNIQSEADIILVDALGQIIYSSTIKKPSSIINIPTQSFAEGIYFLEIKYSAKVFHTEVLIVH